MIVSLAATESASFTALVAACAAYWRDPEVVASVHSGQRSTGLSDEQANWRIQFENIGETQLYQLLLKGAISASDVRHTPALEWLREQEATRRFREQLAYSYTQRTFWAAVAAVMVGIIGVVATLIH